MNNITSTPHLSTNNAIPAGVYDLDTLRTECKAIGVEPTRPNIRRIRRAIDLHQSGAVRLFGDPEADSFIVRSQTEDKSYIVLPHSGCNCPDAKRLSADFGEVDSYSASWERINQSQVRCKHEMAVALFKEQQADQAKFDQWADEQYAEIQEAEANAHTCYPECFPY